MSGNPPLWPDDLRKRRIQRGDSVLPRRFRCWYHAAKAAAFAVEGESGDARTKFMNWEAIGAVGEITGAAAVVATLGYLALQTSQSNKLARSEAVLKLFAENRAHRNALAQDRELSEIMMKGLGGEKLSEIERFRFQARTDSSLSLFEAVHSQFESGIISREDLARYDSIIRLVVKANKELGIEASARSASFQKYIEELLLDA